VKFYFLVLFTYVINFFALFLCVLKITMGTISISKGHYKIDFLTSTHKLNMYMTNKMMKYKAYQVHNFRSIPQMEYLSEEEKHNIEVVGNVLPFKVNNYVIDELIEWHNYKIDPIFRLTFPQKEMLTAHDFEVMRDALQSGTERDALKEIADGIRMSLNPHPAGQMELNVPSINGERLPGVQHKYEQTLLFFPS